MKNVLKIKFTITQFLLLTLVCILLYMVYSSSTTPTTQKTDVGEKSNDFLSILKDPAFIISVIGLVFTYLIIDRWKSIESRIEKLREDQNQTIKLVEERAEKQISDKVEKMIDRAETIDRKVSSLIEDHPWLGIITENNIVPDIPTCSVVLETSNKLLQQQTDKRALVQEYIYFWVGKRKNHQKKEESDTPQLEGTNEDFLILMNFCEDKLNDKYLAFLILQAGYSFSRALSPYYLKRLINYGYIQEANKVATSLKNSAKISLLAKFIAIFKDRYYVNADFQARCFALLSLFEAIKGREKNSKNYLDKAKHLATKTKTQDFITCVQAEIYYYSGEYDLVITEVGKIDKDAAAYEIKKYINELLERVKAIL